MSKKKLGIGEPLINKKFKTFEEAVAYAKRLKVVHSKTIKSKLKTLDSYQVS